MDENYQDVDFKDAKDSDKNIRGKILYYSTSQIATLLGASDSKIRYYTTVFDDILKIEISNKQRQYVDKDIEKLKFIIELKSQGMTIRQIQEYCQEVSFDATTGVKIEEKNPLSIQTLAHALLEEQNNQMIQFKEDITIAITKQFTNQLEILRKDNIELKEQIIEQVALTVDSVVADKLTGVIETQQEIKDLHQKNQEDLKEFVAVTIDNMEQEVSRKLIEREDKLKQSMAIRKEEEEKKPIQAESEKKKNWWERLIGK